MTHINTDILLNSNTLIFKDSNSDRFIFYDFNAEGSVPTAGLLRIGSTVSNNVLHCDHVITHYDWTEVINYLYKNFSQLRDIYETLFLTNQEVVTYFLQRFVFDNTQTIEYIKDKNLISYALFKGTYSDEDVVIPLWICVYYRETGNPIFSYPNNLDDTLVFSVVDFYQHPSYLTYLRNIANPASLVPEKFQTLYTESTRPSGLVSTLNEYIFVQGMGKNNIDEYFINYVYPNKPISFIPYFNLNPAHYELNTTAENAGWAFRFEVVSTSSDPYSGTDLGMIKVFSSGWLSYSGSTNTPTYLFPTPVSYTSTDAEQGPNVNASNILNRHFRGTRYVIYVVPKELPEDIVVDTSSTDVAAVDWHEQFVGTDDGDYRKNHYKSVGDFLAAAYRDVESEEELRNLLINQYRNYKFYLLDLQTNESLHTLPTGVKEVDTSRGYRQMLPTYNASDHTVTIVTQFTGVTGTTVAVNNFYTAYFKSGEEVLALLKNGSAFKSFDITFKFVPYIGCVSRLVNLKTNIYLMIREHKEFNTSVSERSYVARYFTRGWTVPPATYYDINNNIDCTLTVNFNPRKLTLENPTLNNTAKFFENGYTIIFYLAPYTISEVTNVEYKDIKIVEQTLANRAYKQTRSVRYGFDDLTVQTINLVDKVNPPAIQNARDYFVFNQDRLVVWNQNVLYISEPGDFYYFKESGKHEFSEKIVKAIQFKNIILVFTVQHLYALAEMEVQLPTGSTNEDGSAGTTSSISWVKHNVLYNILTDSKYADAIKVFNQMVLFYSSDGQLFFIKPSTQIDDQTRFSLQYFNKAANDILQNYDVYINERLIQYGKSQQITKEDVNIKVNVSVNTISIFYCVPDVITYCLVYDVLSNRYSAWDTLSFTNIKDIYYGENGYVYKTIENDRTYFSMKRRLVNSVDNNYDVSYHLGFQPQDIQCLIDTGNININNHLLKRFRDLNVTFKNINATEITFDFSFIVDGITVKPFYEKGLQVKTIGSTSTLHGVETPTAMDLLQENVKATIMGVAPNDMRKDEVRSVHVANYTSEKILTQRSTVVTTGKVLRMILQFNSKGTYKILGYGVIYKERRI